MEWMGTTAMRHNRLGYYIREGINSIFTHGFMSFASICIIIACLLIMGSFALLGAVFIIGAVIINIVAEHRSTAVAAGSAGMMK